MIIGEGFTSKAVKAIFSSLVSEFSEIIHGNAHEYGESKINNSKIENKIIELADYFSKFEADQSALFLSDVQAAFSKENIRKILKELRTEPEWDLEAALCGKLLQLCREYRIVDDNVDYIIEHIVERDAG